MRNYELHYAELNSKNDIPLFSFRTFKDLVNYVCFKIRENQEKKVFLVAKKFNTTVPFVTDNLLSVEFYLEKMPSMGFMSATFIQEYESFEEAYSVALTMCEDKELCYSKNK